MSANRINAGTIGRLFFEAFTETAGVYSPKTDLLYSDTFTVKNSQQRINNVWQTGVSLGTLTDGAELDDLSAGLFIQHATLGPNIYSIDVAASQVVNTGGVDAIRLQLAVSGVVFVPYIHTIDVAVNTRNAIAPLDATGIRSAVGLALANLDSQLADIPTVAEFEARTLVASAYFDPANDTVARVTLVDTCTTNTDMRGTDGAVTSIPAVTLATTQPSITWQPQTITAGDGTPNITLAGSGNADGIAWTRAGSGNPLDQDIVDQVQTTILNRLGAWTGTGVNTILGAFKALLSKTAAAPSDIGGTFDPAADSTEAIRDRGDVAWVTGAGGGGSGSATIENQEAILAALTGVEIVQTPSPNVLGDLVLTQGDQYDDVANPKARWTVATDYTDGWSVALTIRDSNDTVVYTVAGEVVSDTVIAVAIDAPTGLTFAGCPGVWQGKFDVQLTKSSSRKTIAIGKVYINEDQTRT
jgi:hypothetical protein